MGASSRPGDEPGSGSVSYSPDLMDDLGRRKQDQWAQDSVEAHQRLDSTALTADSVGPITALRRFGQVYAATRGVYLETLKGVQTDLDAIAQGLRRSAQEMRDRDDQAGAAFLALQRQWSRGTTSERERTRASATQQVEAASESKKQPDAVGGPPPPAASDPAQTPSASRAKPPIA